MTGTGKTATAVAFAKDLWGDEWKHHWIDFNSSDERGIDTVRDEIKRIAKQQGMGTFRIVFLDEIDSMTDDAQRALRRIMEDYSENTKFILSCNHPARLLDAIRGRCVERTFSPIDENNLSKHLMYICDNEGIEYEEEAIKYLAKKSQGKVRNAIQELQALSSVGKITKSWVERQTMTLTRDEIKRIFKVMNSNKDKKEKIQEVDKEVAKLYRSGINPRDILVLFYDFILDKHPYMISTLAKIGDIDTNISRGANPLLQLRCFFAWSISKMG